MEKRTHEIEGTLELSQRNDGFLRSAKRNYAIRAEDVRVSAKTVQQFGLRGGEFIRGSEERTDGKRRKAGQLVDVATINGLTPADWLDTTPFKDLVAVSPEKRVRFETDGGPTSMRVVDLLMPVGFGQRALIVASPRTGKTVLLQQMAAGVAKNHPDVYMLVLLVDERPEEVTEMRRSVHGEVVASSNDQDVASHLRTARLMIASAKRRLEAGEHVFILLDSLTRLGRAFNAGIRGSGRIMSGGLDIRALEEPKSIFGAARNIENGGSLTIVASALIDTGSRMDEVIFNEFKGTGNMEIMLSRDLANKRTWPAIDLQCSGTRKEELLLTEEELAKSHSIRRNMIDRPPDMAMQALVEAMEKHPNNASFVSSG